MKRNNSLLGGAFIILGLIMLSARFLFGRNIFSLGPNDFWPIIVLMIGVVFELVYFVTLKVPGFLVPGGILTTCGLLFFFEVATNWRFSAYTWPVYILAVAISLFQLYLFSGRPKGLLIPVGILASISITSVIVILFRIFLGFVDVGLVIPVLLILAGLVAVFGRGKPQSSAW